jgi:hypothetical protein
MGPEMVQEHAVRALDSRKLEPGGLREAPNLEYPPGESADTTNSSFSPAAFRIFLGSTSIASLPGPTISVVHIVV